MYPLGITHSGQFLNSNAKNRSDVSVESWLRGVVEGSLKLFGRSFMDTAELQVEKMIYLIRGQKVMLDSDLSVLYEVETKYLNRQVRRNIERFPEDFAFQLTGAEFELLKTTLGKQGLYGGRRFLPYVFTESGVAMLSSVLGSPRAIQVNIAIMRTFIKLRSFLAMGAGPDERITDLEKTTNHLFKIVFERLDDLEEREIPKYEHTHDRKKIGLNQSRK